MVHLVRSSIPVTLSLFMLAAFATSASASGAIVHGRGLHAEAALYAGALGDGRRPAQILDRLCANPEAQRRCEPIRPALERAITRAADRPISWVHRLDRHAGDFWVLAPIRFGTDSAKLRWAWRDPRPFGCFGGGQLRYRRIHGAWKLVWGIGYEGCPASTG
jgi:hypothetical protein